MSIRYKLLLAFSAVVFLAAGVAAYGYHLISSSSRLVVGLYDGPMMAVNHARLAQLNFTEARRAVEKAIVLREAASVQDFKVIESSLERLALNLGIVRERMTAAAEFNDSLDKLKLLSDEWYKTGLNYLRPPATGLTELPLPQEVIAKGNEVQEAMDIIVEYASAYGLNFRSAAEATAASSKTNLMVCAVAVVLAGLALAFFMAASFSRAIRHAMSISEEIASGNFTVEIKTKRRDELGRLLVSLDKTRASLDETVSGIIVAANEVSSAAAEIAISSTDLSQRTEEQAAGLEETSATLETISGTVRKSAESAQRANEFVSGMRKMADDSSEVVGTAVAAMAKIEESSHKIGEIIVVIDEIARQTNLLALNAAVEAARAGETGRGFAVVAAEVRNLAQRSAQAAKDINNLISNSSNQVKNGVELVNRTGNALDAITDSIRKVSSIVAEIATAAGEQAESIDQVKQALHQLDEVTQQNSALVEENAATAKALDNQSVSMSERVAVFKLRDGSEADGAQAGGEPLAAAPEPLAARPVRANQRAA